MQYFLILLAIVFLYLNYKIIASDIQKQMIPNTCLGGLLGLLICYAVWVFISGTDISLLWFMFQILFSLLISFFLYSAGIWSAGNAKYLLVLALFLPHVGILTFIGNIALLLLAYLLGYFVWFYIGKVLGQKGSIKQLKDQIVHDLSDRWTHYKKNQGETGWWLASKWIGGFLLIFISIRLLRIYMLKYMIEDGGSISAWLMAMGANYHIYMLLFVIGAIMLSIYITQKMIWKIKFYVEKYFPKQAPSLGSLFFGVLGIMLLSGMVYEYQKDAPALIDALGLILSISIIAYVVFIILRYSYRITFHSSEQSEILISELEPGMILDTHFASQLSIIQNSYDINGLQQLCGESEPAAFFRSIHAPLTKQDIVCIRRIQEEINVFHQEAGTADYDPFMKLRILRSFSLSPYILGGFFMSYFFGNTLIVYLIQSLIQILSAL